MSGTTRIIKKEYKPWISHHVVGRASALVMYLIQVSSHRQIHVCHCRCELSNSSVECMQCTVALQLRPDTVKMNGIAQVK